MNLKKQGTVESANKFLPFTTVALGAAAVVVASWGVFGLRASFDWGEGTGALSGAAGPVFNCIFIVELFMGMTLLEVTLIYHRDVINRVKLVEFMCEYLPCGLCMFCQRFE